MLINTEVAIKPGCMSPGEAGSDCVYHMCMLSIAYAYLYLNAGIALQV